MNKDEQIFNNEQIVVLRVRWSPEADTTTPSTWDWSEMVGAEAVVLAAGAVSVVPDEIGE